LDPRFDANAARQNLQLPIEPSGSIRGPNV
jgi:hypothetical protein